MPRTPMAAGLCALACCVVWAQEQRPAPEAPAEQAAPAPDPQWEALKRALQDEIRDAFRKQTADLQNTIVRQQRQIAELERRVRALENAANQTNTPLPARGGWRISSNWELIRMGMPESVVRDVLGDPTSVDSVVDKRVLYYNSPKNAPRPLRGSVTLVDDRVTEVAPPEF